MSANLPSVSEVIEQWADDLPGLVALAATPGVPTARRVRYQAAIEVLVRRAVREFDAPRELARRVAALIPSRLDRVYDDRMARVAAKYSPGNWTGD